MKGAPLHLAPTRLRYRFSALVGAVLLGTVGTVLAGVPVQASTSVAASHTLHLAFGADMQVPDPDIFYEIEGNAVVTSVYEGLVKYANNSTKIVPALATSWTELKDGLTYTFDLRHGVRFHDGSTFTAADAVFSFERRKGVNSAPAYMVANVTSMSTPNPYTFVVHLNKPVSAFLDYMASPYGPKMVSEKTVKAHETGGSPGDWAQGWLKTHDAGTGPYEISEFVPGSHYVLKASPYYWGTKPYYTTIDINIVPDISTQQVELQDGQLSLILHGLPVNAVENFSHESGFTVQEFPAQLKTMLYVNPTLGVFQSSAVRQALRSAIDKAAIVASVYGNLLATVSTQAYPVGEFPKNMALDDPKYDPSLLSKALKNAKGSKNIDLAYLDRRPDEPAGGRVHPDRARRRGPERVDPGRADRPGLQLREHAGEAAAEPARVDGQPRRRPSGQLDPHLLEHQRIAERAARLGPPGRCADGRGAPLDEPSRDPGGLREGRRARRRFW